MKYIDMHCDTLTRLYDLGAENTGESLRKNSGHLDLERMRAGEALIQCFAIFTNLKTQPDPYRYSMAVCDLFWREMEKNRDVISPVLSAEDLLKNENQGKMSALLTIEEGAVCRGETEILREFYERGARMMTLTWNYPNDLAWPNRIDFERGIMEPETEKGLTKKGIAFLEEMERLGMIIDVSHLGDAGFFEVAEHTKRLFIASHSNARGAAGNVRNLTDEMIRLLADRGGVMGINFCPAFLSASQSMQKGGGQSFVRDMVSQMKYIRNVGGIECIGLGSDFDGITGELEVDSPAAFWKIADEMHRQGFAASEIESVFYRNARRVFTEILH